ncbi:MAG: chloramphenicol acetyltransferase [Rhodobiaceae bacterium]|nr:MAG: chloramphenicol acetyltransferase [Rhodobiaceae bacterium]
MTLIQRIARVIGMPLRRRQEPSILMSGNPAYENYEVGRWTYGRPKVMVWNPENNLKIGNFCSIAADVCILLGGEHRTDFISTYPFGEFLRQDLGSRHEWSRGDINIGNDVWIGRGATICSGVTISDGAVIGAHALVTRDVGPYVVAAGNPAKEIRRRFDDETITKLLAIKWWDWSDDHIRAEADTLMSNDQKQFLDRNMGTWE